MWSGLSFMSRVHFGKMGKGKVGWGCIWQGVSGSHEVGGILKGEGIMQILFSSLLAPSRQVQDATLTMPWLFVVENDGQGIH
jgi:hypothetical protein